ncbi:hypothetical protein QL285_083611 [Trifolium repens]|nr:hypothetical protein QL285_083609 [Trifolium repens]KAK2370570.1 hypothetical protein QL285_083611 [Trifolium repens]
MKQNDARISEFKISRTLPIGESPMLLLRVFQDVKMIPLASLSHQERNGVFTLACNILKRSTQFKVKVAKMEVGRR